MNDSVRSSILQASREVENTAMALPTSMDDETLLKSEARQLEWVIRRLNDISYLLSNMVDHADARRGRRHRDD